MQQSTRSEPIAGSNLAVLAVVAMALVFLGNGEAGLVPVLQMTGLRWAVHALAAVMILNWVEALAARFFVPRDDEGDQPPAGLHFAAGVSSRGERASQIVWAAGLAFASLTAALLFGCAGYIRQVGPVPLDVIEIGVVCLAIPATIALVLSSLWRRGVLPA